MKTLKKWESFSIVGFSILGVGVSFITEFLKENGVLWCPALLSILFVISLVSVIILLFTERLPDEEKQRKFRSIIWSFVLVLSSALLFRYLINPSTNDNIRAAFFKNEIGSPAESTTSEEGVDEEEGTPETIIEEELEDEQSIVWFSNGCIPTSWEVFNYDVIEDSGCWDFGTADFQGLDNGFVINPGPGFRSFYIYRPVDEISEISFIVEAIQLLTLDEEKRTDFYFGFIPYDTNSYYSTNSAQKVHFNGDYIFVSGQMRDSTYGFIRQRQNPLDDFFPELADKEFKGGHLYEVKININGDHWDVYIKDLTDNTKDNFISMNNDILGNFFVFGFRIRETGIMNLKIINLNVE